MAFTLPLNAGDISANVHRTSVLKRHHGVAARVFGYFLGDVQRCGILTTFPFAVG